MIHRLFTNISFICFRVESDIAGPSTSRCSSAKRRRQDAEKEPNADDGRNGNYKDNNITWLRSKCHKERLA